MGNIDLFFCHRTFLDIIASNHPLEVFSGWVAYLGIKVTSNFYTFDLSLSVTFLVSRYSVDECEVFIARFIVMHPALVHSEFHIWFSLRFSVDYEHLVFDIIGEPILLYDVAQSNDVGDGSLAEPNAFVIARHFCLVGHYHGTTIDIESHSAAGILSLCYQCLVAEQIHCGLTFQKYYLPEVQLVVEVWRLVEDLGNVWLEFSVQLCEL